MDTQTLGKLTRLEKLQELYEQIKAEDLDSLAHSEHARLEERFWDVWRWRQRLKDYERSNITDGRTKTLLEHLDTLLAYVEAQRDVLHRMLTICAKASGRKGKPKAIYNRLCQEAERYLAREVDPELLRRGTVHKGGPG